MAEVGAVASEEAIISKESSPSGVQLLTAVSRTPKTYASQATATAMILTKFITFKKAKAELSLPAHYSITLKNFHRTDDTQMRKRNGQRKPCIVRVPCCPFPFLPSASSEL